MSPKPRPYVISIVGVNGVGKSTNLSKLAFFLLQNNFTLLIAACDTFRSGAVEQLRVHTRNLKELSGRENLGKIELYEKGYGQDAANIAKDAVAYAASQKFDVVLIDTAGRRHNDTRLMSNLEKFGQFANPDKILMVGEALVGSDSVAQARNFNAAFGPKRGLDGFIISKCDTVGDMVGSLISMVHATGIPVVFLGVGQHYGDLRTLNVSFYFCSFKPIVLLNKEPLLIQHIGRLGCEYVDELMRYLLCDIVLNNTGTILHEHLWSEGCAMQPCSQVPKCELSTKVAYRALFVCSE